MFKLIVCIVPHDQGEVITSAAKAKGAGERNRDRNE